MQVLYLVFSSGFEDACTACFSDYPAFPVLILKSFWSLSVWLKKHISLFKGRVDDRVYGEAEPVTLFTLLALLDLRPFTLGVCDPVDMECCCRSIARPLWTVFVILGVASTNPSSILSLQCFCCAVFKPFLHWNTIGIMQAGSLLYCL